MFRPVCRNQKQILSNEQSISIMERCSSGILALLGDEDYTYGVPMSYAYKNGKLYYHAANNGHKIDAIKKHDRVSFTVIETDNVVQEEFTTYYRSVIVFGKIRFASSPEEKLEALNLLVEKYSPGYIEEGKKEIEGSIDRVQVLVLDIDHISGKEAIELVTRKAI
jgi:hypothetical protein